MSSWDRSVDIEKQLSRLLREHVVFKYTKSAPKSYQELLNYTIELEINNTELERKIEFYKTEEFKLNQIIMDLQVELGEANVRINSYANQLKLKEKFTNSHIETEVLRTLDKTQSKKTIGSKHMNKSENVNLNMDLSTSSFADEISIDKDLKETIKKKKILDRNLDVKSSNLQEENKNLLNDLNLLVKEVQSLRSNIEEKDNIIAILYQEVENLKNFQNSVSYNTDKVNSQNGNKNRDNFTFNGPDTGNYNLSESGTGRNNQYINMRNEAHLEDLNLIKKALVNFLKNYGIHEDFQKLSAECEEKEKNLVKSEENIETQEQEGSEVHFRKSDSNAEYQIEIRMKEIKYILVNLKKINIIFKTLFMEFSKNIVTSFQNEINTKFANLNKIQNKMSRLSISLNNFYYKKLNK